MLISLPVVLIFDRVIQKSSHQLPGLWPTRRVALESSLAVRAPPRHCGLNVFVRISRSVLGGPAKCLQRALECSATFCYKCGHFTNCAKPLEIQRILNLCFLPAAAAPSIIKPVNYTLTSRRIHTNRCKIPQSVSGARQTPLLQSS